MGKGEIQELGGLLQKAAGSGRALVVHDETDHPARRGIDLDGLRILPTDIDDGPGIGVECMGAHGVARDLGDDATADIRELQRNATVARTHHIANLGSVDPGRFQQIVEQLVRTVLHPHARRDARDVDLVPVEQNSLGRPGTNIDAKNRLP